MEVSERKLHNGKAIKLINIDEDGNFSFDQEGQQALENIENSIALVCVAGAYRSGKSFLLGQMIGNFDGFEIGHTSNKVTKGVWMWSIPKTIEVNGENVSVIFCDTEGLYEVRKHKTKSDSIFVLTLLISSYLIINDKSHIQESTIEKLSIVTNLAKLIKLNSNNQDDSNTEILARNFPYLMWLLRDKQLKYTHRKTGKKWSENEYLESCLEEDPDDKEENNMIRSLLQQYFPRRGCIAMNQPTDNSRDLDMLGSRNISISRDFIDQVKQLMKNIDNKIVPKRFNKEMPMNGVMMVEFIKMIIEAINKNGEFCIAEAYDSAINYSWSKIENLYFGQMEKELDEESKVEVKTLAELTSYFNQIKDKCISEFEENEKEYYVKRFKLTLVHKIDSLFNKVEEKYQQIWYKKCEEIAICHCKKFFTDNRKMFEDKYPVNYKDFITYVGKFEKSYLMEAPEGTNKEQVLDKYRAIIYAEAFHSFMPKHEKNIKEREKAEEARIQKDREEKANLNFQIKELNSKIDIGKYKCDELGHIISNQNGLISNYQQNTNEKDQALQRLSQYKIVVNEAYSIWEKISDELNKMKFKLPEHRHKTLGGERGKTVVEFPVGTVQVYSDDLKKYQIAANNLAIHCRNHLNSWR